MEILVVDAANVVGSRPDGWWRDRQGAARRLHRALVDAELDFRDVVIVLEGKARLDPEPEPDGSRVMVINATGSGDDAVVAEVERRSDTVVVTSDRGLRARVAAAGGRCVGPSWLLERVEY